MGGHCICAPTVVLLLPLLLPNALHYPHGYMNTLLFSTQPASLPDEETDFCDPDGGDPDLDGSLAAVAEAVDEVVTPGCTAVAVHEAQLTEWIDAIVDGNQRALAALYDATVSRVYGLVLRMLRKPALAEEVVEDTYFQVWRQAVRFDAARARVMTWLLNMARSRAIDTMRREARFQHDSLDDDSLPEMESVQPAADELLEASRNHADLHRALMQLSAQPRQLLALAFFRGLSHEDISQEVALPLGTVKSQIRRALISLRQLLGGSGLPVPVS